MASLANQTISSTYDGLVKTATDQPVGVSGVQLLEDGVGNSLALSVGRANQGVTVTGTLTATTVTGTLSATSVLADGVIATTQATSDNSTKVATTAFVKSVVTAEDLDIAGDTGTGAVDLDSQVLTIAGTANEIETSASGQTITIGLPSTITANVTGNVSGNLTGTVLTAAQTNITSVGTLSSLAVSGNLTVDTNTLFVDSVNNEVGIGTSSPAAKLDVTSANGSFLVDTNGQFISKQNLDVATAGGRFTGQSARGTMGLIQIDQVTTGADGGRITFDVSPSGSTTPVRAMEIDSSGNLLVSTANTDPSGSGVDGTRIGSGILSIAKTSAYAADFGRNGTDGEVIRFRKAGSTVGAINVTATGASIYLGGFAAANELDDYEEGTWTPATSTSGYTISASSGVYTKIGRQVTIRGLVNFSAVNAGSNSQVFLTGLPFTPSGFFTGIARENTASGAVYAVQADTTPRLQLNSMDSVATGSQRTLATSEQYVLTVTYFV